VVNVYRDNNRNDQSSTKINSIVLGNLQTLSVQTHREKFGVRALGKSYVKGYTRGPRTIAGSMIFTLFNEHALAQLIRGVADHNLFKESALDTNLSTLIPDQLPPLDLTIAFANEYGSISRMGIYGVEFLNDSQTFSIEDLMTEAVVNFTARDIDVMTKVGIRKLNSDSNDYRTDTTGSDLYTVNQSSYNKYLKQLGIRRGLMGR